MLYIFSYITTRISILGAYNLGTNDWPKNLQLWLVWAADLIAHFLDVLEKLGFGGARISTQQYVEVTSHLVFTTRVLRLSPHQRQGQSLLYVVMSIDRGGNARKYLSNNNKASANERSTQLTKSGDYEFELETEYKVFRVHINSSKRDTSV